MSNIWGTDKINNGGKFEFTSKLSYYNCRYHFPQWRVQRILEQHFSQKRIQNIDYILACILPRLRWICKISSDIRLKVGKSKKIFCIRFHSRKYEQHHCKELRQNTYVQWKVEEQWLFCIFFGFFGTKLKIPSDINPPLTNKTPMHICLLEFLTNSFRCILDSSTYYLDNL